MKPETSRVGLRQLIRSRMAITFSLVALFALYGCSSSGNSSTKISTTRTSDLKPGQTVPFVISRNARSDVHAGACQKSNDKWVFSGTVSNAGKTATSFQLIVDFVRAEGDTVLSTSEVELTNIQPGAVASWSTSGATGQTDVSCILRQAQTT